MNTGLLAQLRTFRDHPGAAKLAAAFGGFVPIAGYVIIHLELRKGGKLDLWQPIAPVALACVLFSVSTVWTWAYKSFREERELWRWIKASCYVVSIEGAMAVSSTTPLCVVALAYLVLINAVATACTLVAEDAQPEAPTVTAVSRELNLPRKAAAKLVDQQLVQARPRPRPAT